MTGQAVPRQAEPNRRRFHPNLPRVLRILQRRIIAIAGTHWHHKRSLFPVRVQWLTHVARSRHHGPRKCRFPPFLSSPSKKRTILGRLPTLQLVRNSAIRTTLTSVQRATHEKRLLHPLRINNKIRPKRSHFAGRFGRSDFRSSISSLTTAIPHRPPLSESRCCSNPAGSIPRCAYCCNRRPPREGTRSSRPHPPPVGTHRHQC